MKNSILNLLILFSCILTGNEIHIHPFTSFSSSQQLVEKSNYGLDTNGILYYDYGSRYNSLGKYNNPTFIAKYADILFREIKNTNDEEKKKIFFKQVDYLIKTSSKDTKGDQYWSYPFENTYYNAPVGWYSGMTSGRILGVLARAHSLSNNDKYLQFAELVLNKLARPIEEEGMSSHLKNGEIWLEEVAYEGSSSFKVLNGHIFSLAGVYDYYKYTNSNKAKKIYEGGVKAVKNNLDHYDSGFISYYSEKTHKGHRYYAGRFDYHTIHVMQLLWLYNVTQDIDFLKKAMKFQAYEMNYGKITVSSSINAKTHGPDKMNLTFGNNYWSAGKFPITIVFDMSNEEILKGVGLLGHTKKSTPRSYLIEKSLDGINYQGIARQNANQDMRFINNFTHDVKARYLKFTVFSDNGNRGLALDGIAVIKKNPQFLVSNFCNYSVSLKKVTDKDLGTAAPIRCNGFYIIPPSMIESNQLLVYAKIKKTNQEVHMNLYESNDLVHWELKSKSLYKDNMFLFNKINKDKYLKLSISTDISTISEIVFK